MTRNFTEAGIMVHAYLMYGYPTQTVQETIDSLEMVRQLFETGVLQSGFWHQFALTAHSPVGMYPEKFGVTRAMEQGSFANNDVNFKDKTGIDHEKFSFGLSKSLYNFMHGICFDYPLQDWFEFKIPKTKIPHDFIENAILEPDSFDLKPNAKIVWIGGKPVIEQTIKSKKGKSWEMINFNFHDKKESFSVQMNKEEGAWFATIIADLSVQNAKPKSLQQLKNDYEEKGLEDFELFWHSKPLKTLKSFGLLVL